MAAYNWMTKTQAYLAKIAGKDVGTLPSPTTREQELLKEIAENEAGEAKLPAVAAKDDGKVLTVVSGEWAAADAVKELPDVAAKDDGKVLTVVSGEWAAADAAKELPDAPAEDGTYTLKISVASGVATLSWVADQSSN